MAVLDAVKRMTVDEYLALPESPEGSPRMELVDGEIIMSPRARSDHQRMAAYLSHLLWQRVGHSGIVLVDKEMVVQSSPDDESVRAPDLCYIQESRQQIVTAEAIRGGADIVIEILSESTEEVDRIAKRDEYQATGVPEYWIVDLSARAVLIHYFAQERRALFRNDDEFESEVLKSLGLESRFSVKEIFSILR